MIVKVSNCAKENHFFECAQFNVREIPPDLIKGIRPDWDITNPEMKKQHHKLITVFLVKNEVHSATTILTNGWAYAMNDEGKTIERLN